MGLIVIHNPNELSLLSDIQMNAYLKSTNLAHGFVQTRQNRFQGANKSAGGQSFNFLSKINLERAVAHHILFKQCGIWL